MKFVSIEELRNFDFLKTSLGRVIGRWYFKGFGDEEGWG